VSAFVKSALAPVGSTGNNTHTSAGVAPAVARLAGVLVIESVGATPTITAKIQGSLDDASIADGSANWFDLPFVTATNDTVAATMTQTATGAYPMYLSLMANRFVKRVRLVTSANTNVTYRGELHIHFA
jgi:hypothetical protein